MLTEND